MISIVGAGVAGLCIATELAQRGYTLTVYEPQQRPGPSSCSWWAGGMLAPYCEAESCEPEVLTMGLLAAKWWQTHTQLVEQFGTLVIAPNRDQNEIKRFAKQTTNYQSLNQAQIDELEPDLNGRFSRGLYFSSEAHLSPRDALFSLKQQLLDKGVTFIHENADPKQLSNQGLVIDCRGLAAKEQLPELRGVKGEMLILKCPDVTLHRCVRLLHPRIPLYIVPRGKGIYMLGATMVESSAKAHVTARSLLELLSAAYTINPAFGEAEIIEIGVDSRPAFNHNLPKIIREGNIIRANGLYRHGFLLSPTLANMVADHIQTNAQPQWLSYK